MAPKKEKSFSVETLELYRKLVSASGETELKGDSVPYTSLNGHMFSYINDGVVVLRLSAEDKAAYEQKYKTGPVISYGVIKKDFVPVPEPLLKKTKELKPYFEKSLTYVKTLKPKK